MDTICSYVTACGNCFQIPFGTKDEPFLESDGQGCIEQAIFSHDGFVFVVKIVGFENVAVLKVTEKTWRKAWDNLLQGEVIFSDEKNMPSLQDICASRVIDTKGSLTDVPEHLHVIFVEHTFTCPLCGSKYVDCSRSTTEKYTTRWGRTKDLPTTRCWKCSVGKQTKGFSVFT
mmetsp:Transcript_8893/g.9868  ORF Transcript_8893/g.9868 Transcript_8893/m.9868 type:complete len:173 (-) Transcript_8893:73-591(-)